MEIELGKTYQLTTGGIYYAFPAENKDNVLLINTNESRDIEEAIRTYNEAGDKAVKEKFSVSFYIRMGTFIDAYKRFWKLEDEAEEI